MIGNGEGSLGFFNRLGMKGLRTKAVFRVRFLEADERFRFGGGERKESGKDNALGSLSFVVVHFEDRHYSIFLFLERASCFQWL